MPRIREVKPEFFLDEQLAEVGHAARLLFIGLWSLCDREGRLEDRPARIKAQVFPYGCEDCEALLRELAEHPGRFILRYEADGRRYIEVRTFKRHQRPHPKETASKIPAPPPVDAVKLHGEPRKETASRETPSCQVDPSGGSMGTWAHGSMGDGIAAAAPLAAVPRGEKSWSQQACDCWIEAYHGTAPGGRIGKALGPLVAKHGWAEVAVAWRNYLAQVDAQYASPQDFAAKYGRWNGSAPQLAPKKPAAVVENNRAVLARFVAGGGE